MTILADRSPAGWDTVSEYLTDEWASDSDDDKKMRLAEGRALSKQSKESKKQQFSNTRFGTQRSLPFQSTGLNHNFLNVANHGISFQPPRFQTLPTLPQAVQRPVLPMATNQLQVAPAPTFVRPSIMGTQIRHPGCYICGGLDHWKSSCPAKSNWYENFNSLESESLISSKKFNEGSSNTIKGNLRRHAEFWEKELGANDFILNVIKFGYKIPLRYIPAPTEFKNNLSALKESEFVEDSIKKLLQQYFISEVEQPHYMTSPLSVARSSLGKRRLVLDLSFLNKFVWKENIKFDDWKIFEQLIESNEQAYFFKFDFKSGHHHVEIHDESQKYLGFSW